MAQWGRNDQAVTANSTTTKEASNGAPIGTYALVKGDQINRANGANAHFGNTSTGSRAAADASMYENTTPGAFMTNIAAGIFGVDATEQGVNVKNGRTIAHAGWVLRKAFTGPVVSVNVTNVGSTFANGESITVSNGIVNATATAVTNSSGNLVSMTITNPGSGFTNTLNSAWQFNRELHLSTITVSGASAGYNNSDIIVASNGSINGTASFVTNATGGFVTANVTITNPGLWPNTTANSYIKFTVTAANGGSAAGNSTATPFTGNLVTSSSGNVSIILGGRAGRVQFETLVAMGSLGAQTAAYGTPALVADGSDSTILPNS